MKQLEQILQQLCDKEGISLSTQLSIVKEHVQPILRDVDRSCQQSGYTYHGIGHVQHIGKLIRMLIPDHLFGTLKGQINPHELFLLIAAAYLHDIGMRNPEERAVHNVVSANMVYDSKTGQSRIRGLEDQYAARISKLCLAHRDHKQDGKLHLTLNQIVDDHLAGRSIRIRLLACILRLADELDSDFERAPEDLELSLALSPESQQHWVTHQLIDSVTIDSSRWEIELYPGERAFADGALMKLVEARCRKIQSELDNMQFILKNTPFAYKTVVITSGTRLQEAATEPQVTVDPFVAKVRELFQICGYQVELAAPAQKQVFDLKAVPVQGLDRHPVIIRCVDDSGSSADLQKLIEIRKQSPLASLFYISSRKFSIDFYSKCMDAGVQCYSYEQIVSQMINFDPYVERVLTDRELLRLEKEYEEPYLETPKGKALVWNFLDKWLEGDSNWLTVLGDYGVGKTALLEMLLLRLMRKHKEAPDENPIPILIPLQNFVKSFTFRNLMLALFEDIGLGGVYYDAFESWVRRGRIVLLLDSFDEMAQKLTRHEIHNNLRALMSGITGRSKAVLTSRSTYFESSAERLRIFADVNLLPEDHEDYSIYKQFSEYDLELQQQIRRTTTAQLSDLTEDQRKRFFRRVLKDNPDALQKVEILIDRIHGLDEMADRPVIARLLMMAVPGLRESDLEALPAELNEASFFDLIVKQLLRRDESLFRELLSNSERHLFLRELAYMISRQGQDNYVDNRTLRELVHRLFTHKIQSHETPEIIAEQVFRTCRRAAGLTVEKTASGLTRGVDDPESRVGFSHNALREYIFAEFIHDHMFGERSTVFQASSLSDGTIIFLRHMLTGEDTERLLTHIQSFHNLRDFYFGIAWKTLPNKDRNDIITIIGDPPTLSELDLGYLDFSDRDLSDADFSNSLIGGVNFRGTILDSADFQGAILDKVAFDGASLGGADFSLADIQSIVVYDPGQKRVLPLFGDQARQWLYTAGSDVGKTDDINPMMRSDKYQVAYRILRKMARYNFGRTMNEIGLLRGLAPAKLPLGRDFLAFLHRKSCFTFVRKAAKGGRGADVISVTPGRKSDLQDLYEGKCPEDLQGFFDDFDFRSAT